MLKDIVVEAEKRVEGGKNESRRMRRAGRVPAVLYGGKEEAIRLSVDPKSLEQILHSEAGANTLFTLKLTPGGKLPGRVMIKDHSVDPVDDSYLHADFMRIAMDKAIRVQVAIHTVGLARGVKLQGGILDHPLREIEVECLPADIPERIDLDISELDLGKSLRVSDIKTSEGVKILTDPGMPVVSVVAPTIEKVAAPAAEGAAVAEAPAEPELIKKGKGETAEE
ncbi:MAG TPA: 50S ribosomal protein L25, partial [Candidatus Polarisedimenticolia bacterium]|nr:50S ribosomal protein L25 [Candidatus Polarisedimenticolia bacterium]